MVETVTADRFSERLDGGAEFALIDTRPADSFEAWHAPGATNVPFDPQEEASQDQFAAVDEVAGGRPVVTVCGKGLTSTPFAFELEAHGHDDVSVVEGGMAAWNRRFETVPMPTSADDLVVTQLQRRAKGCLSYVVGSWTAGAAVVVDPPRLTEPVKVAAANAGLTVERVVDTHVHADHISGGPAMADALDVPYHLGAPARERGVERDFEPLADGDVLAVGDHEIGALHTPGHTTESTALHVDGLLFTGDTLFLDSVGRTELQFGDEDAARGAELLFESLHETVRPLSDDTVILPGHVTVASDGRYEGATPGSAASARLGDLRDRLDLLGLDGQRFVERLTADTSEKPSNYEEIVAINTGREAAPEGSEASDLETGPNDCAA
jgi:glyoxylase-like metal-dependent hydrolase (beta-lactamase superfamily II)/rhodanese-related sulfurtransferase